jgi:cytochrome c2
VKKRNFFLLTLTILFIGGISVFSYADNDSGKSVKEGERLFEKFNCYECHTIAGIGYAVGPALDGLVQRKIKKDGEVKYKEWLKGFLKDPQKAVPGTAKPMLMKKPTDAEFDKIYEFIKTV